MKSVHLSTRVLRLLVSLVLMLGAGFLAVATTAAPAQALCTTPALAGSWKNIDSSTRSMTRAQVSFVCSDVRLCDTDGNCTGGTSYYNVRMYGKCSPTDCDWGTRRAQDMGNGWIRATYGFGFKTSSVWLKTYSYYGRTYLRVYVVNDFTAADGRADYTTDEWMLP